MLKSYFSLLIILQVIYPVTFLINILCTFLLFSRSFFHTPYLCHILPGDITARWLAYGHSRSTIVYAHTLAWVSRPPAVAGTQGPSDFLGPCLNPPLSCPKLPGWWPDLRVVPCGLEHFQGFSGLVGSLGRLSYAMQCYNSTFITGGKWVWYWTTSTLFPVLQALLILCYHSTPYASYFDRIALLELSCIPIWMRKVLSEWLSMPPMR